MEAPLFEWIMSGGRIGEGTTLRLRGEIDLTTDLELAEGLLRLRAAAGPHTIDLAGVTFMACSGLGRLMGLAAEADPCEPLVLFCRAGGLVHRMIKLARLDHAPGLVLALSDHPVILGSPPVHDC